MQGSLFNMKVNFNEKISFGYIVGVYYSDLLRLWSEGH